MTTRTLHPLAADYLDHLRRSAARLPRSRRTELVAEIAEHISDAIEPEASDAEALTVLDRLGDPEEIVEAEQPRPTAIVDPRGTQEWAAIFLLLFGGFFAGIGWLAGLIFLWGSRAWTTRDKWIGTLLIPGGLAGSLFAFVMILPPTGPYGCVKSAGGPVDCNDGPSLGTSIFHVGLVAFTVLAPLVTTAYLVRRAGTRANRP